MADDELGEIEWFELRHTPIQKEPVLNIQAKGSASMNTAAFKALGEPKYVRLGFIPTSRSIVIRPTTENDPAGYPLRPVGKGISTRVFSMKAFTVANDIPVGKAQHFVGIQHGDMLVFKLGGKTTS